MNQRENMTTDEFKTLTPQELKSLLAKRQTFHFKRANTGWNFFYVGMVGLVGIALIIVGFTLTVSMMSIIGGIVLAIGGTIVFLYIRSDLNQSLILSPDAITLIRGTTPNVYPFNEIFNIEFYIITINNVSEKKFKIITNQGKKRDISLERWITPKPLPSDEVVRTILNIYFALSHKSE
jgi:hypothetical protein